METALLNGGSGELPLKGEDGDYRRLKTFREWRTVFWMETVKLWRIGGPIAFTIFCQFGINSVTTMFAGHIGNIELSAVSIALYVIGTFSFGFLLGMGSALETLCGQAFGAGQVHMLGIYMQRSWIILSVTCIILLPIYIFATPLLKLLGQEDDIADLAGKFAIQIIPQFMTLNGWEAMLFIGINATISVRVSNELGLGHPRATKYAVYVTVFQSLLIGLICAVIVLAAKDYFAVIFTSDKDMQQAVARLAYLLGITMILNSVQPVISGVAIGGGWQAIVAYINLGSYYIFGLPLGYLLGYKVNLGVQVEQTTARMRRWGGQDTATEKLQESVLPSQSSEP
ncbi:hypothetical protein RJ640_023089 [Escallonia rubra]|uniref:Uncharacterized protein n=1 Tax=Escallonia rubra TaxID=112253 RepID=A0AA88RJ97_9ASTE|nr:hypothetical protein RJ640_023089 [Escallonia rubra]